MRLALFAVILAAFSAPLAAETPLQRGTYLVEPIVACGNCHPPMSAGVAANERRKRS